MCVYIGYIYIGYIYIPGCLKKKYRCLIIYVRKTRTAIALK